VPGPFTAVAVSGDVPSSSIQRVELLPLRVDADMRVVLQHTPRQVAADRLEDVIGDIAQLVLLNPNFA
jgi:hypothetical protein